MSEQICPCQTDVEDPGPHIAACPYADPDYDPDPFGIAELEMEKRNGAVIMGIDPGFASLGLAVLHGSRLLTCDVIETKKDHAPRAELRVSVDDSRRLGEFCARVGDTMDEHNVRAVAIEVFTVVPGKMAGGALKTAMVYGALYGLARARGCLWLPLVPGDLKRGLCGLKSATKTQIQDAVSARIPEAGQVLAGIPKTKREHAADAIAAAIVGQGELRRLGVVLGRAA